MEGERRERRDRGRREKGRGDGDFTCRDSSYVGHNDEYEWIGLPKVETHRGEFENKSKNDDYAPVVRGRGGSIVDREMGGHVQRPSFVGRSVSVYIEESKMKK